MNRRLWTSAAIFLTLAASARATSPDWEAEFKTLCSYDTEYCGGLKNSDGTWKMPKKEMLKSISLMSADIKRIAQDFGVDPRAVAGSIIAENSLNVTISDDVQDLLVKFKLAKNGTIPFIKKKFSFGWGQLYMEAAKAAAPLVAKINKLPRVQTEDEIAQALLTPEGAFTYASAVVRMTQDIYRDEFGFKDIAQHPEILATLYNLGKPRTFAAKSKAQNREPRVNFFGFFVKKNMPSIEEALGLGPSSASNAVAKTSSVTTLTLPPCTVVEGSKSVVKQATVTHDLVLYSAPDRCSQQGSGQMGEYTKVATLTRFPLVGKVRAGIGYEVLAPGLGCDVDDDWTMIRAADGIVGWTRDKALLDTTQTALSAKTVCDRKAQSDCLKKAAKLPGSTVLSKPGAAELELRLQTMRKDAKKVSWRQNGFACSSYQSPLGSSAGAAASTTVALATPQEIDEALAKIAAFKSRIAQAVGIPIGDFDSTKNPYASVFQYKAGGMISALSICTSKTDGTPAQYSCKFAPNDFNKLEKIAIPAKPTYKEIKAFMSAASVDVNFDNSTPATSVPAPSERAARKAKFIEAFAPCGQLPSSWSKAKAIAQTSIKEMNAMADDSPAILTLSGLESFQTAGRICALLLNKVLASPPSSSGSPCTTCGAATAAPMANIIDDSGNTVGVQLTDAIIESLLKTNDDRAEFMADQLQRIQDSYAFAPASASSQDDCSDYSPFATAQAIENLLKLPCVESIQVPDPWLVRKFEAQGRRVIYRPFEKDDRFVVSSGSATCIPDPIQVPAAKAAK